MAERPWRHKVIGHLAYVYGDSSDEILFITDDPRTAVIAVEAVNAHDDLVAALRAVRADGMLAAHGAHWDKQGTHGANCPACIANRKALDIIDAALAKAEQP